MTSSKFTQIERVLHAVIYYHYFLLALESDFSLSRLR